MRIAVASLLVSSLMVPFAPNLVAAPSSIDLDVGKTQKHAYAFGSVSPARPGRTVRIKLQQDVGQGYSRIERRSTQLDAEGSYDVRFARPDQGQCRFVVTLIRKDGSPGSKTDEVFPCAMPAFGSGTATITSDSGPIEVALEIADEDVERQHGLMYRRWLREDKGMAFLWEGDTSGAFYMKNTLIPLSIAFFDATGRIVKILDMEPCDADPCPLYDPGRSYRGALEVNQGAFETWGVAEGDTIVISEN